MTLSVAFSRQSLQDLQDVLDWTVDTFGPKQAIAYDTLLRQRIKQSAEGLVTLTACHLITQNAVDAPYDFIRAGQHIIVVRKTESQMVVLGLLHSRSNLSRHISSLLQNAEKGGTP